MTSTDAVRALFVEDWALVSRSPAMGRALRRWRSESGGLVDAWSADELIAQVKQRTDGATARKVSGWLLARDEPLSRRILVQASEALVKTQIARSNLKGDDKHDWMQSCLSGLHLAVGGLSGSESAWPMWAIRRELIVELKAISVEYKHESPCMPSWPVDDDSATKRVDYAVALGRVLRAAVVSKAISQQSAQLLWLSTIGVESDSESAARLGLTAGTVRKSRTRTVRRVTALMAA